MADQKQQQAQAIAYNQMVQFLPQNFSFGETICVAQPAPFPFWPVSLSNGMMSVANTNTAGSLDQQRIFFIPVVATGNAVPGEQVSTVNPSSAAPIGPNAVPPLGNGEVGGDQIPTSSETVDTRPNQPPQPIAEPQLTDAEKRYNRAMEWLLTEDEDNHGKTHLQTYIEKRSLYIEAEDRKIKVFQEAYRRSIDELSTTSFEKQREAYNNWLKDNARDLRKDVEAAYEDWIINGRKEAVEHWFTLVDDESAFGFVQKPKEVICKSCGAKDVAPAEADTGGKDWERIARETIDFGIDGKQGAIYYTREISRRQRKIKMLELLKKAPPVKTFDESKETIPNTTEASLQQLGVVGLGASDGLLKKSIPELEEEIKQNEDAILLLEEGRKKALEGEGQTNGSAQVITEDDIVSVGGREYDNVLVPGPGQDSSNACDAQTKPTDYLQVSSYLSANSRRSSVSSVSGTSVQSFQESVNGNVGTKVCNGNNSYEYDITVVQPNGAVYGSDQPGNRIYIKDTEKHDCSLAPELSYTTDGTADAAFYG